MVNARRSPAEAQVRGLRVAALVATATVSGPGRQLAALAREVSDLGVEFLIVLIHRRGRPPNDFARYLAECGLAHRIVEDRGPLDWRVVRQVGQLLEDWQPAVVQTHTYKPTAVAYALRRLGAPWKWVGWFHGLTNEDQKARFYHWLDRRLLGHADRIVVVSREQVKLFAHAFPKVRVIHNAALALARCDDGAERLRLHALFSRLGRPRIGVVGRLSPEKGIDVFLQACAVLVAHRKAFSAVVAGDGPEWNRLQELSRRLALEQHVHFLSHVRDIGSVYAQLDLLVLPSRSEGLPNALLEALQADLPIVATRVGGVPDVIGSSAAAVLVPPASADALAGAMEHALAAGPAPEASSARAAITRQFSLSRRVADHLALYRDVLHGRAISERSAFAS
jgi:glycosyltransferase involved in cell wall biosynthesis